MSVFEFFAWWSVVWGATMIETQSHMFTGFRFRAAKLNPWFGTLAICPMCMGFWVGVIVAVAGLRGPAEALAAGWPLWARAWADGAAASAVCWLSHVYLGHLGETRFDPLRRG